MTNSVLMTLDGTAHDFDAPLLAADDLAAVRGDGIFETLLVRAGRARGVRLHLERLVNSAHALGLPEPDVDQWSSAIEAAVKTWDDGQPNGAEGLLRLVYSRGRESEPGSTTAYLTVTAVPDRVMQARSEGVSVVTLERGFSVDLAEKAPWQLLGAKTLSYATNMAALRHAAEQGFDDVIFLSSEGAVLEGPRSTVIAVTGKALVTPPTEIGILTGTTARAVFELAAQEGWSTSTRVLRPADLIAADSVWMVSSVTLAARVTALNRYVMPVSAANDEFVDLVDRAVCVD
ncbi:aminodeoxychorismate lyase [Gordonia bronchialis]|uniref:aminodeoxychorismate lyase n=1 Tax=Gordonia bronchialis TaxID=2054 RepID=UPI001CBE2849|nr:aminodeoxychorismate lyase [Gordonia bronchialis]UAK37681.1 aminodeoxychorismate lyase [Gordonia bronchialis]